MRRSSSVTSFETFLTARERASTAFVEGNSAPLLAVSVDTDPATIYTPTGAVVVGADAVNASNAAGAETFAPGPRTGSIYCTQAPTVTSATGRPSSDRKSC